MRPDENSPVPQRPVPANQQTPVRADNRPGREEAAANIVRSQIDNIYQNDPNSTMVPEGQPAAVPVAEPTDQPKAEPTKSSIVAGPGAVNMQVHNQQSEAENPYERTHDESRHQIQTESWNQYHSAWQSYYQQYYERYYVGQVYQTKKTLEVESHVENTDEPETISGNEAMYDLRTKLRAQINEKAHKVRKSRHFMPIMAAVCVMLIFLFLQYNRLLFATVDAYVSPGSLDPSTLIVNPDGGAPVSSDPRLIVPKISVDVPIIWDANAASEASLNVAMGKGVAWFDINGADAKPGEMGNFVLSGHSSNDWLDQGDYKFIFARLDQLNEGDTIYVNYNSTRYVYTVSKKSVVKPTDVSALEIGHDKPHITLLTCTPLGTALNRLLVFADQVSPDPNSATAAASSSTAAPAQMPANSPTFIQRLFGAH